MANKKPKNFKKFILDASYDSGVPVSQDTKRLIRGFYRIVSKKKYDNSELEVYLKKHDYVITTQQLQVLGISTWLLIIFLRFMTRTISTVFAPG